MNSSNKLLSQLVSFRTYAKHLPHLGRRESFEETINRNMQMHLDKFPKLSRDIIKAYQKVHEFKIMPSMRGLQFSGEAILKNNIRQYNCSYLPIDDVRAFGETLFLLLSGVGVGFSVQKHHVNKLPKVNKPREEGLFMVHDSIEGWAQAVDTLMEAYFFKRIRPIFDYSQVRQKDSYLVTTGAKAPGPKPLQDMLNKVEEYLESSIGRQLKPIELHDILCIISDCVLSGGIRRSATISFFDRDDNEMLKCKHGEWWVKYPWRARANNSAVLPRNEVTKEEFDYIFKQCQESNSGEPGFSWTNDAEGMGFNPCVSGDTEILTKDGYVRIDSVVDQEIDIWNGFEWSKVTPKITGQNQPMLTINTSDGRILRCTEYHSFHISTDYHGKTEKVLAKDLEPGMKIIKHQFPIIEHGEELKDAYTQGFVSAEGMELNRTLYVYPPKKVCIDRLQGVKINKWEENNKRFRLILNNTPVSKSLVPINYNLKSKLEWLSGLFDGDGCELKQGGLQLSSVNRPFLTNLQKLLTTLGIQSKVTKASNAGYRMMPDHKGGSKEFYCQEANRICIGAVQIQNLIKLGLKCERLKFEKEPQRDASQFVTIVSVDESGIDELVYCFNEPKRHYGVFNGILTGQCHEIALNSHEFCNLVTINQTGIRDEKDFLNRVYSATLLATLQAAYTDFPYLRPIWKEQTEKGALIGVSFTGIADNPGLITKELLEKGAKLVLETNEKYAKKIGINPAARTTTVKPEGTSSCVLGSSSGIHARHSDYYLRRFRINKGDSLDNYLRQVVPGLVEDDLYSSTGSVVTIPQESPVNSITRVNETAETLLERIYTYNEHWVKVGHRSGDNQNNVSATVSVKPEEWDLVRESMWNNRERYSGISLLPYDGGTYKQAPFEDCTKEVYEEKMKLVTEIDLKQIKEQEDNTNRTETVACAGGVCEITQL